jgi:hypothetical protein
MPSIFGDREGGDHLSFLYAAKSYVEELVKRGTAMLEALLQIKGTGTSQTVGNNQVAFTTPGTYSWVVPAGVFSISAVGVGGGGGSWDRSPGSTGGWGSAGYGGSLRWKTSIPVTPGETLTIIVGDRGTSVKSGRASNGGVTKILRGSTVLLQANGGTGGGQTESATILNTNAGGIGDGGGDSGTPAVYYWEYAGGGCGAGGYSGNGGAGGANVAGTPGANATGGGGGGGFGVLRGGSGAGGRGGGVGILGAGSNGAGAGTAANTKGGAGSQYPGSGEYGGGASEGGPGFANDPAQTGACRIVWGTGRTYPNYVPDV